MLAKFTDRWRGLPRRRPETSRRAARGVAAACVLAVAVASVAACSSSSPSSSSSGSASVSPSADSGSAASGANVAAAKAAIAPYSGHPGAFPVAQPLSKPLPAGTKFAFMECGTGACGLVAQLLVPAVKEIGGTLVTVNAGSTAQSSQTAVASVLALKPAAVLITGLNPTIFGGGLKTLSAAGIKVVTISIAENTKPFGITFNYIGLQSTLLAGKLMADWVIANKGPQANVVFYGVPAIDFSAEQQQAFEQELQKNCPTCKVRAVQIDVTTLGTTSANTVVSDLESHPATNVAVFASAEIAEGLPAAMKAAGLSVTTLGYAPQAEILQDI